MGRTAEITLPEDVVEERWRSVLASIQSGKHEYDSAPWHPLPGEPRLAQLAFYSYRDSPQRNPALVAASMQMRVSDVLDLAKLYEWQRRAECYDEWAERMGDDARAELIAQMSRDAAQAFARLPQLAMNTIQLVECAVNAKLQAQADAAQNGYELDPENENENERPISITQGMRLAEMMRGLLDATTRYLTAGKIQVEHTHRGTVGHVHAYAETDAILFLQGLSEAGFDVGVPAIETTADG